MDDRVCVTGREVREFIDSYKFTRRNLKNNSELFNAMKRDINKQIVMYGTAEEKFYKDFHLNGGLPEFQKRFDEILSGNLHKFSNVYLQQSTLFTQTLKPITNDQVVEWVKDWIKENVPEAFEKQRITEKILDKVTEKMAEAINNSRGIKASTSSRNGVKSFYLKGRLKDLLKGKSTNLGEYSKDFRVLMQESNENYSNSTYEMEYEATFSTENGSDIEQILNPLDEFSYYPYFGLTEEQQKEAVALTTKQSKKVWENFKNHIKAFLIGDISESTVEVIMNQLGPYAFIKNSLSGVKGILGELQMLFVVAKLMGEANISINKLLATGSLRNKLSSNKAELGADILYDETIGLQVKNYKGHWLDDKPVNYWLKSDLSFSTFQERVEENGNLMDFDKYVSILNYNQPNWAGKGRGARGLGFNKESYEKYNTYYNNKIAKKSGVINTMTKLLVAENMDKFLTLQESYELLSGDLLTDLQTSGRYVNAFYVFGGVNIIPVRTVFELLLKRVEELEKALLWKQSAKTDNFYVRYNYTGTVWPVDVTKDQDANYSTDKTIQSVLDDLSIELKLNIWLSDLNFSAYATTFRH